MPRSRSSGALSIESNARNCTFGLCLESTLVIAAVNVVLPWSICPMVPIFTCGLLRSNFSLPIAVRSSFIPGSVTPTLQNLADCKNRSLLAALLSVALLLTALLLDYFFRQHCRQLCIMRKMHGERCAALRAATQIRGVTEH